MLELHGVQYEGVTQIATFLFNIGRMGGVINTAKLLTYGKLESKSLDFPRKFYEFLGHF